MLLKTPKEWEKITEIQVIKPDGWTNENLFAIINVKDYDIKITKREFLSRIMHSYVKIHENIEINMCTLDYKFINIGE